MTMNINVEIANNFSGTGRFLKKENAPKTSPKFVDLTDVKAEEDE